ncbi:MAG: hypothetical protein IPK37_08500 [Austwickia sp.]|jgi:hypothetical protein|nr:MAG: hypothetical protein IPK37_08500 [Austwickia sp.]
MLRSRPVRRRRRRRPRRAVALAAGVLLAFGTANTGLEAANRAAFPSRTTTGVVHSERVSTLLPHAYWVFFPGFGIDFCPDVERALVPVTRDYGRSFCVAPSPAGLDPAEIARTVRARVAEDRTGAEPVTLYLYGISMGGMLAYDVARQLDGHDGITVRALIFDSSPAGPESVSGAKKYVVRAGAAINRLPDLPGDIPNPLKGGPLNRFAGHAGEAVAANLGRGDWPLSGQDLRFAWYKATRVTSGGVTNQLQYIEGFYPAKDPAALPYAAFAYLRAQDPGADTTVDVLRAITTYVDLVAPRELAVYPIVGGTHASADTTVASYAAALRTFVRSAGLPTADDMERLRGLDRVRPL